MKKHLKYLTLLLVLPLLGGCGHTHTFATEWSFNDAVHYHVATCEHTDLKSDEGSHNFVDGFCSVCGFQQPHVHTFSESWSNDEDKHWHDSTCGHDVISDEGEHTFVNGVCSECGYEKGLPPHVHTFSDDWTSDESGHWHAATCEHTDLKTEFGEHTFEDGNCTVCDFSDPNYQVWTDAEKQIFKDHLYGFELPCVKGLKAEWDVDNACVLVYGAAVTHDSFNVYVNTIVAQGFEKQDGPYEDTYILLKDVIVDGKKKTIDIDIFIDDNSNLYAICYDPYVYEWPTSVVNDLYENYFYIAPTVRIPSIAADRYFADTSYMSSDAILSIYCYSEVDLTQSYKDALVQKGFNVKQSEIVPGAYVATEPQEISEVNFVYSSEEKVLTIVLSPSEKGWPSLVVDYYTDQLTENSGTRVPALTGADSYEFIDVYDRYGYFFVLSECSSDLTTSYETLLDEHYTLYNEKKNSAGNYWAISDKNDLLVQYVYIVTESQFGGKDYKHFDVLFEKYFPINKEHIEAGLELIQPGTETTLPDYPGYGEKIDFSSTNKYMTVTIQAATFDSVATYVDTLIEEDWSVKEVNPAMYNYQAISDDRDIYMEISLVDGRVTLTLSAHEDLPAVWPTEGINEILTTLGVHGEVPVFDGAFGYDYENDTDYHDIICMVPYGKEQKLIDEYHQKLKDLGWRKIEESDDFFYYVISGSTIGLTAYTEYAGEGKVFINIQYGDGDKYDVDMRQAFIDWKIDKHLDSTVLIPGINLSSRVIDTQLVGDDGITYPGYSLFEILLDMGTADIDALSEEVIAQFVKDGWTYSADDTYYHKGDSFMTSYEYEGYLAVDVCVPIPDRSLLGLTESFISKLKTPYCNTVIPETLVLTSEPSIEIDTFNTGSWFDLYLYLDFDSAANCKTAMGEIKAAFEALGWTEDEYSETNDILLIDPTGDVRLELYRSGNSSSELHYEIERID